jgi:hypothetical protein
MRQPLQCCAYGLNVRASILPVKILLAREAPCSMRQSAASRP